MKRVLVISHNVFSPSTNVGKTLSSYFEAWDGSCLAQLYIHSELPNSHVCENYYRVTDKELLASVLSRRSGRVLGKADIRDGLESTRVDRGLTARIYQYSRKRSPLIYFARDLCWLLGRWNTAKLQNWLDEFQPELVFFASGDYGFMYRIALKIAKSRGIPLYVSCMDDFYFYNKNENKLGGGLTHRLFMRQVKRTMSYADGIFSICDKMSDDYSAFFGKPCRTLHTASSFDGPLCSEHRGNKITYIGNLSYGRERQLEDIGRALQKLKCDEKPRLIEVYSTERRERLLRALTPENGISFCGECSSERLKELLAESRLIIHTESFEEHEKRRTKYSVSTKLADSLASGACILAYGPEDIASMQYLRDNSAAICIESSKRLSELLEAAISDAELRAGTVSKALRLAKENHSKKRAYELLYQVFDGEEKCSLD